MEALRTQWDEAMAGVCNAEVSAKWWDRVVDRYTTRGAEYHNQDYILELFQHFETVRVKLKEPQAVILAIFFHKMGKGTMDNNDDDEAQVKELKDFFKEAQVDESNELATMTQELLAACGKSLTEAHMIPGSSGDEDRHYLVDITVASMGAAPDQYFRDARRIQQECHYKDLKEYAKFRLKVLESLMKIPNFYATMHFRDLYEKQTRRNMVEEIQKLNQQLNENENE